MNRPQKNLLEWAVFATSLALVLAVIGYLVYTSFQMGNGQPDMRITLGQPTPPQDGEQAVYTVPITLTNHGERTAEEVQVEVTLWAGGEAVETAQVTVPLVPRRSSREALVAFRSDPQSGRLEARVTGYLIP